MIKHICILLPFLVSLFWTIYFFINRKINSRSQNIWTIVMGLMTITTALIAFYWYIDKNYSLFYKLSSIETFTTLLCIPVIFLYFRELTGDKRRSVLRISLFFIPPFLFAGICTFGYLVLGDERATYYIKEMIENNGNVSLDHIPYHQIRFIINEHTYGLLLFAQAVSVFIYAIFRLLLYRRRLNDYFSEVDDRDSKYYWAILWGVLAFMILSFIVTGLGYTLYIDYHFSVSIIMFLYAIILYYISYNVSCTYHSVEKIVGEIDPSDDTDCKSNIHLRLLPRFNQVINEDKIYLQKKLRVDDVASLVGTNRTYISRILKDEYNCSFWEFINRKRIEYAKGQIKQNPELMVDDLAEICGFSHASTFCRTFRQYEKTTFKEWQRRFF